MQSRVPEGVRDLETDLRTKIDSSHFVFTSRCMVAAPTVVIRLFPCSVTPVLAGWRLTRT